MDMLEDKISSSEVDGPVWPGRLLGVFVAGLKAGQQREG